MDINRFESLGDNCELGFFMRKHGVKESNLLRWAITSIPVLCDLLRKNFSDLYKFENLEPCAPKMLLDRGTNLKFHSDMVRERKFVPNHQEIYPKEVEKIEHLLQRMKKKLHNPNSIFVYKDRHNPSLETVQELADLVAKPGGASLLYVTKTGDMSPGEVVRKGPHLFYGRIDRFAEYAHADEYSEDVWSLILNNADQAIPMREQASS